VELEQIAAAAGAHGRVTGVLAAESATGRRSWLVALDEGEQRQWLVLDNGGTPVEQRATVREVASLVAMAEVAAELAGEDDVARVASPSYLDKVGTTELGSATGVVEAFVADVERGYKLPLR
jgi:hypothetical protein